MYDQLLVPIWARNNSILSPTLFNINMKWQGEDFQKFDIRDMWKMLTLTPTHLFLGSLWEFCTFLCVKGWM